jgi:hypothetical protein
MKYGELVQFDPVESVKVLVEADDPDQAQEDVRTFVISDRMADQLVHVIIPNLQFEDPTDQKGLLIVANYGTGKTHLMSVISGVAERSELRDLISHDTVKEHAGSIAGRFQVIRAEIGAVKMSLRDIFANELQDGLAKLGVDFIFPDAEKVTNNKDALSDMMVAFEAKYPDLGLLLVLDELLDYLRTLRDTDLVLALSFLREVGEISRSSRFRFIGGIQEAIFDNPRFAHVADSVRRVKDRFEQVRISREDVAFVVQARLLKKTAGQRGKIKDHLQSYTPLYEGMAEDLERYVDLFPVHPAYLEVFEQLTVIEKREILKALSREIGSMLDADVPEDRPGLVAYDSYRQRMSDDPSFNAIDEVRTVLEVSDKLRNRVTAALATPKYKPVAQRIIDALTVHRLTTGDIHVPIGPTRAELRDDLCLLPDGLPEMDAFFLETTIDSIVAEIIKAVSGQFISENQDNGQIYLDVKKDIDYEELIRERANSLDDRKLDEAYYKALEELLNLRDAPYVSGYRIWEYELPWTAKNVMRIGYLFMGAPNERSTAQPPRDYYVYFLQPFDPPKFADEAKPDEVFFRFDKPDEELTARLRTYAGATALATETASGERRSIYEDKARTALQSMVTWLRGHMGEAFTVIYQGDARPLGKWLGSAQGPRTQVKDQVDSIASTALADHFVSRYPGYPQFEVTVPIGKGNLGESVKQALNQIAGRKTQLGTAILRSLELLDSDDSLTNDGAYAVTLESEVAGTGGKVLNRKDLLTERDRGVFTWGTCHLEPAWVAVIAAALTQQGRMEIGYSGGQIDALGLDRLTSMSLDEVAGFSHLAPPKGIPIVTLKEVAKLLGLAEGIVHATGVNEQAVQAILQQQAETLKRVVDAQAKLAQGVTLWGAPIIDQVDARSKRLADLQSVLENVKARNSVGKMNRLELEPDVLDAAKRGRVELEWLEAAFRAREHLSGSVEYLREAAEVFGEQHPLTVDAQSLRTEVVQLFQSADEIDNAKVAKLNKGAKDLSRRFADEAAQAHARDRLDGAGDKRKQQIVEGDTMRDLETLSVVSILPDGAFGSIRERLVSIGVCMAFNEENLKRSVICPDCKYRPKASTGPTAQAAVEGIADEVDALFDEWRRTLLDNLRTDEMSAQIELLDPGGARAVKSFLDSEALQTPVSDEFARALDKVFKRFIVRNVNAAELWKALFPEKAPTTIGELNERYSEFIGGLVGKDSEEKIRVVPTTNGDQA